MTDELDPTPSTEPVGDVRADVLAAIEKHSVEEPVEQTEQERTERARDKKTGRYAETEAAPKQAAAEQVPESGKDEPAEKTVQVSTPDGPPPGWPVEAKTEWTKLSPAIQAAVIKREQEISSGGRQWSEEKRRYEETLAPIRQAAQKYGADEREGIQRLVAANDYLERDPVNALKWLAQTYGVDITKLAGGTAEAPRVDPVVNTLYQELNQLKQKLSSRESQEAEAEISRFAKDRPHFQEVRVTMGRLLEAGEAESMEDAYDKAVWAHPSTREKLLSEREAASTAEREKAQRVEKQRRGAVSITGSPTGLPASTPGSRGSVRDDVLAAWKQHAG